MNEPTTYKWTPDRPSGSVNVYVKLRKDGKYHATYCFTARQVRALITRDEVEKLKASDSYRLIFKS